MDIDGPDPAADERRATPLRSTVPRPTGRGASAAPPQALPSGQAGHGSSVTIPPRPAAAPRPNHVSAPRPQAAPQLFLPRPAPRPLIQRTTSATTGALPPVTNQNTNPPPAGPPLPANPALPANPISSLAPNPPARATRSTSATPAPTQEESSGKKKTQRRTGFCPLCGKSLREDGMGRHANTVHKGVAKLCRFCPDKDVPFPGRHIRLGHPLIHARLEAGETIEAIAKSLPAAHQPHAGQSTAPDAAIAAPRDNVPVPGSDIAVLRGDIPVPRGDIPVPAASAPRNRCSPPTTARPPVASTSRPPPSAPATTSHEAAGKRKRIDDAPKGKTYCELCDAYRSTHNFARHMQSKHNGAKTTCPICKQFLVFKGDLRRHMKLKHPNHPLPGNLPSGQDSQDQNDQSGNSPGPCKRRRN
ncbi:hypothetical protein VP01_2825g1 [Puccinia sorghi]|uniref:C2H2-type domain-containing protein n=1 Tax=Puccinia sorghi TaxID=27349 RepID=A0A0L6V2A8_9BASI|nr:hypothetical protein VP01_2825g1 [Puccinia sorghi]